MEYLDKMEIGKVTATLSVSGMSPTDTYSVGTCSTSFWYDSYFKRFIQVNSSSYSHSGVTGPYATVLTQSPGVTKSLKIAYDGDGELSAKATGAFDASISKSGDFYYLNITSKPTIGSQTSSGVIYVSASSGEQYHSITNKYAVTCKYSNFKTFSQSVLNKDGFYIDLTETPSLYGSSVDYGISPTITATTYSSYKYDTTYGWQYLNYRNNLGYGVTSSEAAAIASANAQNFNYGNAKQVFIREPYTEYSTGSGKHHALEEFVYPANPISGNSKFYNADSYYYGGARVAMKVQDHSIFGYTTSDYLFGYHYDDEDERYEAGQYVVSLPLHKI